MTEHIVTIADLGDGRHRAVCSCGYRAIPAQDRPVSEAQAEQHQTYHAEVAELTREQEESDR